MSALTPLTPKNRSPKPRKALVGLALLGTLSLLCITAPPIKNKLTPSAFAYPYDLSPSGKVSESLTAEIAAAQARIQRNPEDGLHLTELAGAYLKMARITGADKWYTLAEESARQSLDNLPFNNDGALLALAKVAEANHDFAEAARLAEQAAGGEALATRVTAQLAIGQIAEANAGADELVEFSPSMASLTLRALARQAKGDRTGALKDFQQAIAVEQPGEARGSALARTLLGKLYADQGDHELAVSLYQEALTIAPQYPQALLNLADLKVQQGRYRAAAKLYAEVDDPLALLGLARVRALQGKDAEARSQWSTAETVLREKVAANPLDHGRELAVLLLERGDEEDQAEAIALMQAEAGNRRNAETLDTLAWALSASGRWEEAQPVIEEAIAQGIQDAEIFSRAARIETALGNTAQAETYLSKAQTLK
ncbi:MAG: tetratricopeptide repeat protein [Cyanobacteria bacterium P01_F01_bin.53]